MAKALLIGNKMTLTIDEWTEKHFSKFAVDIEATAAVMMTDNFNDEKAYRIRRLIMISLRDGKGYDELINYNDSSD